MATFAELKDRVGRLIIDLPSFVQDETPRHINLALREAQLAHNFHVMEEETAVLVTSEGQRVLSTTPTDWKEIRGLPYTIAADGTVNELLWATDRAAVIRDLGTDAGGEASVTVMSGPPAAILRSEPTDIHGASNLEVWPLPDGFSTYANTSAGEYRIVVPYWKYLPALSANGDYNWFTTHPHGEAFIVWQAVANGFFADWDEERGTLWTQRAAVPLQKLIQEDKRARLASQRTLVPSPDAAGSRLAARRPGFYGRHWLS